MALAAVIPPEFQGVALYAGIAVILAIIGWGPAGPPRCAARCCSSARWSTWWALGASPARVIGKYIVPNASSHIIVMATLYVPEYLLVSPCSPSTSWATPSATPSKPATRNRAGVAFRAP